MPNFSATAAINMRETTGLNSGGATTARGVAARTNTGASGGVYSTSNSATTTQSLYSRILRNTSGASGSLYSGLVSPSITSQGGYADILHLNYSSTAPTSLNMMVSTRPTIGQVYPRV